MGGELGLKVPLPAQECRDVLCPFHGKLPVRGQTIDGTVVSDKMSRTVVVQREYFKYLPNTKSTKNGNQKFMHIILTALQLKLVTK